MEKFTKLSGVAAPFTRINVDTDLIIPAEHLKTISRLGLGKHLFSYIRYNEDGSPKKEFILNQDRYKKSTILVTGKNFGCGSSREHAVWALSDFGIKCLIGSEFADIFYNNCFKNGILPIILDQSYIDKIIKKISFEKTSILNVNLEKQIITIAYDEFLKFKIDPYRKKCLLEGADDITLTLNKDSLISKFESNLKKKFPWLDR